MPLRAGQMAVQSTLWADSRQTLGLCREFTQRRGAGWMVVNCTECFRQCVRINGGLKTTNPAHGRVCRCFSDAYLISTARLSWIFLFQMAGPVICTDSPLVSTATVTGMSFTSNS